MAFVQNGLRYLWAILISFLVALLLFLLRSEISAPIIGQFFLLFVGVSAALWGLGPSVLSAMMSFLLYNFLFIEPYYSLMVRNPKELISLFVFLIVAVVISQLIGQMREKSELATQRELEALRLYELSNTLAGYHDVNSVLKILAELVQEALQAQRVVVVLDVPAKSHPTQYVSEHLLPDSESINPNIMTDPEYLIPLQAAQSVIGEIRVWLPHATVSLDHKRFLETCAAQAALTLERIRLSDLDTRSRILEESDRLKTALLSSVSHELRTPLSTIKASVSSLREEDFAWDSEARKELLAAVEEETDQLNQLVGNLLSMSRIEAGAMDPERQWNELREIIERVLSRMKLQSHRMSIRVSHELPLVAVDFVMMEQVFNNLISNSVKFSPENSLISISAEHSEEMIIVKVINQGPPVPEEHLDRIFDKFHRIPMSEKIMGIGLGLSICKGIIEAHGGRIWAENTAEGFSFVFTLPTIWEGASSQVPK
jgi:two-component system, OmpR family, sensor histidine kinase KdpD